MHKQNDLIETIPYNEWDAIVYTTIRRYIPACTRDNILTVDDLKQEAWIAILDARDKYDPSRGVKFHVFAINYINWHILRLINRKLKLNIKPHNVSEEVIDDEHYYLQDDVGKGEVMEKALEYLGEQKHIDMFLEYFMSGKSIRKIASEYDLSHARIHMIIKSMLDILRCKMKNENAEDSCFN